MRSISPLLFSLLLATVPAANLHANDLETLVAKLRGLRGESPISVQIHHEVEGRSGDEEPERGEVRVTVESRGGDVAIVHRAADLDKIREEDMDPDPDRPRPATRAMESIEVSDIAALIDYAPRLLRYLEGAKTLRRSRSSYEGKATTLLELELPVRLPAELAKRVSKAEATMKLWVLDDGTPVASERKIEGSGRFLILRFRGGESSAQSYTIRGDRLVVSNRSRRIEGAGFGREFSEQSWTRLTLEQ